jgi:hypothetical protein
MSSALYFCLMLTKFGILDRFSSKSPIPKLHINQSSVRHGDIYGHSDRQADGRTNSLILFQSNRTLLWRFNVDSNNKPLVGLQVE